MSSWDRDYVVLAVEDDENHAALINAVFAHTDMGTYVNVVASAEEARDYLTGTWPFSNRGRFPIPDVIVLDLSMPGLGGMGLLRWLSTCALERDGQELSEIPVVVFTSVEDPGLAQVCYSLGAREFKVKPDDFTELVELVEGVVSRWRPRRPAQ